MKPVRLGQLSTRNRLIIGFFGVLAIFSVAALILQPWSSPADSRQAAELQTYLNDLRPALERNLAANTALSKASDDMTPPEMIRLLKDGAAGMGRAADVLAQVQAPRPLRRAHRDLARLYRRAQQVLARTASLIRDVAGGDMTQEESAAAVEELGRLTTEMEALDREPAAQRWKREFVRAYEDAHLELPGWMKTYAAKMERLTEGSTVQ